MNKSRIIVVSIIVAFILLTMIGLIVTLNTPNPTSNTPVLQATDTPTPVLTYPQRIEQAINLPGSKVTFNDKTGKVVVTYYAGEMINYDSGVLLSKMYVFDIEKAIWNDGLGAVQSVEVHIQANLIDPYGKNSIGDIATATLTKTTATRFVWNNLDQNTAWLVYDTTWLLPG